MKGGYQMTESGSFGSTMSMHGLAVPSTHPQSALVATTHVSSVGFSKSQAQPSGGAHGPVGKPSVSQYD